MVRDIQCNNSVVRFVRLDRAGANVLGFHVKRIRHRAALEFHLYERSGWRR